jgi:uncharacterized protein YlbG (UPF0298 family)
LEKYIENRSSLIVYVYSTKQIRQLKRYGLIYYVSQKMHYVVLYVNTDNYDWVKEKIGALRIVNKIESTPYQKLSDDFSTTKSFKDTDDDEY